MTCQLCFDDGYIREGRNVFSCLCMTKGQLHTTKRVLPMAKKAAYKNEKHKGASCDFAERMRNEHHQNAINLQKDVQQLEARIKELEAQLKAVEPEKTALQEKLLRQCQVGMQAQQALDELGLPDLSNPNFKAQVIYTAYLLGLLQRKEKKR